MSKKTIAAQSEFQSLKDMGYQQAGASDTLEAMARYALNKIVDFPQSIDDESKAQLYAGYKLRFAENNPAVQYAVINGQYIPAESGSKAPEKITLTVHGRLLIILKLMMIAQTSQPVMLFTRVAIKMPRLRLMKRKTVHL